MIVIYMSMFIKQDIYASTHFCIYLLEQLLYYDNSSLCTLITHSVCVDRSIYMYGQMMTTSRYLYI